MTGGHDITNTGVATLDVSMHCTTCDWVEHECLEGSEIVEAISP